MAKGTPLAVLFLEDSEDDMLLNLRELKGAGYAPSWVRVETGEDLSTALAERSWDIVLADHNLPRFDALSALRMIKARGLDVPCIIVSGSIGEEQLRDAMQEGAQDYVLKRDLSRLSSAVPRALDAASERRKRRQAELARKESEERYALAVVATRDGIWDWDVTTGVLYCSDRIKDIFGVEEIGGRIEDFSRWLHDDDRERVERAMAEHLTQRTPYEVEYRIWTGTGELRWIAMRGQVVWDADGKPIRMVSAISDITPRKFAEETLRQNLEIIREQAEAIRTLSTPIIEVWDGVLMMPVYGAIDGERTARMMETLLSAVARTRCRNAIIDLTSVETIDPETADHIVRLVRAVELIGARGIVVGIRANVARIMVTIGKGLERITTLATLREALVMCMTAERRRR